MTIDCKTKKSKEYKPTFFPLKVLAIINGNSISLNHKA